jgi:hypothetical protein
MVAWWLKTAECINSTLCPPTHSPEQQQLHVQQAKTVWRAPVPLLGSRRSLAAWIKWFSEMTASHTAYAQSSQAAGLDGGCLTSQQSNT